MILVIAISPRISKWTNSTSFVTTDFYLQDQDGEKLFNVTVTPSTLQTESQVVEAFRAAYDAVTGVTATIEDGGKSVKLDFTEATYNAAMTTNYLRGDTYLIPYCKIDTDTPIIAKQFFGIWCPLSHPTGSATLVSKKLTMHVREACRNPYVVCFLTKRGFQVYTFELNQKISYTSEEVGDRWKPFTYSLEFGAQKIFKRANSFKVATVFADGLSEQEYDILREIINSPSIYKIEGTQSDHKRIPLICETNDIPEYETRYGNYRVEFTFIEPELNNISN